VSKKTPQHAEHFLSRYAGNTRTRDSCSFFRSSTAFPNNFVRPGPPDTLVTRLNGRVRLIIRLRANDQRGNLREIRRVVRFVRHSSVRRKRPNCFQQRLCARPSFTTPLNYLRTTGSGSSTHSEIKFHRDRVSGWFPCPDPIPNARPFDKYSLLFRCGPYKPTFVTLSCVHIAVDLKQCCITRNEIPPLGPANSDVFVTRLYTYI